MTMEILKTRIDEILKKMWGVNEDGASKFILTIVIESFLIVF